MKKRSLLISATAAIIYLTTSSYSGGPAHATMGAGTDYTGGAGSSSPATTCGSPGCHSGGSGTTTGSIEFRKKAWGASSTPINYYEAGETYLVTIKGGNASLSHFGFQFVALRNAGNTRVGTYSNFGTNIHGYPHAAPTIVEHSAPITKNGTGDYVANFEWTAPAGSVGAVTLYAIINAVNNNGISGGDMPGATLSLSLNDKTSVGQVTKQVVFKAYPNPVQDALTLDLTLADAGTYDVTVYNTSGAIVSRQDMNIYSGNYTGTINTSAWTPGLYFVQIQKDGDKRVMPVVKQ